ncbi:MAG: aminotransferase class V-fold PLP-dependent enzyme [Candidatus Eisenbacteria bacterium]
MAHFGRDRLADFLLDPGIRYLNHGTVGATPRAVLAAQQQWRDRIERNPATFLFRELTPLHDMPVPERAELRLAAHEVARRLGGNGDDLVFTDNITAAANAVLRSLVFGPGDEVLVTDHNYGAITLAAQAVTRGVGALVRTAEMPRYGARPEAYAAAVDLAIGPRTRLVIVDHITSGSALVLPVEDIVATCRKRGVPILVDGAHVPGQLPLDLDALGADWYVANLHKWAFAPRSCGFLWAPPHRQTGLHPAVISWGLDHGFTHEFDWVGTRDFTPWLSAPAGFEYLESLGEPAVRQWNHALAYGGALVMAARWGVEFETPESMIASMATVPLPGSLGSTPEDASRLRDALLFEDRIEVPVLVRDGRLWIRVCGQVYNEPAEYEALAEAVAKRA